MLRISSRNQRPSLRLEKTSAPACSPRKPRWTTKCFAQDKDKETLSSLDAMLGTSGDEGEFDICTPCP